MQQGSEMSGPVEPGQRVAMLDVWRGFAVLGILILNIPLFAMPEPVLFNPQAWGSFEGANYFVWLASFVLADGKFITTFSMLFGVGILVMTDRRVAAGQLWVGLHYRRMAVLLVIGLAHAYLIWYGDILVTYALCGMLLVWYRKLPTWALLGVFVGLFGIGSLIALLLGLGMSMLSPEQMGQATAGWADDAAMAAEVAAYQGGWLAQMPYRAGTAFMFQTAGFLLFTFWSVGGLMALGMVLYRMGVLRGEASSGVYLMLLVIGVVGGLPVPAWGAGQLAGPNWSMATVYTVIGIDQWATLLVALAWLSGLLLLIRAGWLGPLPRWLAAVGRLALTNYLLQSIICTTIFYGHGFGLFGRVDRVGQMGIVVGVWVVLVIFSTLWLRRFQFGPVEWLWRRLSYGNAPPIRQR